MSVNAIGTESRRSLLLLGRSTCRRRYRGRDGARCPHGRSAGRHVHAGLPTSRPRPRLRQPRDGTARFPIIRNATCRHLSQPTFSPSRSISRSPGQRAAGFLAVFPGDITWPGTSSVNWFGPNQNLSNNAFVFVPDDGVITVRCGGLRTHFVIDLIGASIFMQVSDQPNKPRGVFRAPRRATSRAATQTPQWTLV